MKKLFTISFALFLGLTTLMAQDTLYIYDSGAITSKTAITDIDSITFYGNGGSDLIGDDGTKGTMTDVESNEYSTVIIGTQEWMAENLISSKYNNGDPIPTYENNDDWATTTSGAYAIFTHDSIEGLETDAEVLDAYGALYNWFAVVDNRNVCPDGWRVPTVEDWGKLETYLLDAYGITNYDDGTDESNSISAALKSCRQVDSPLGGDCATNEHPRWNATLIQYGIDKFGFSALPACFRYKDGRYEEFIGEITRWWTPDQTEDEAWGWMKDLNLTNEYGFTSRDYDKENGYSVRCMRDID